ncbi:hypothetical protein [Streptosporangium subroseum]|uniref:hypothetical protein n=1 Tax=Streptosporangium subroseum TaxID=106412 RepID=UPI0030851875|nr:hypothetical protein OHB15_42250 [Streptosporangium subroseum]
MKKKLAIGVGAVTAAVLLMGSTAWATQSDTDSSALASNGVTTTANRPPKANGKLRKPKARARMAGIHGQATVGGKDSKFVNRTWQRGVITAKGESSLTVKSKDGVTWTWNIDQATKIHKLGARADLSKLVAGSAGSAGDTVFVIGTVTSSNPTAASVFAPRKAAAPATQEPPITGS